MGEQAQQRESGADQSWEPTPRRAPVCNRCQWQQRSTTVARQRCRAVGPCRRKSIIPLRGNAPSSQTRGLWRVLAYPTHNTPAQKTSMQTQGFKPTCVPRERGPILLPLPRLLVVDPHLRRGSRPVGSGSRRGEGSCVALWKRLLVTPHLPAQRRQASAEQQQQWQSSSMRGEGSCVALM